MYKLNFAQSEVLSKMMDKYPDVLMDRGEGLFWEDKIELIDQSVDEHQFFFNAFGSKKETYEVDVDLTPINDGRKKIQLDLQTFCSCPYFSDHGQCKHVAAALCILDSLEVEKPQLGLWSDNFSNSNSPKQKVIPISVFPSVFYVTKEELGTLPEILPILKTSNIRSAIHKLTFLSDGIIYGVYVGGYPIDIKVIYNSKEGKLSLGYPKSWEKYLPDIYHFLRERFSEPYKDHGFLTEEIRMASKKAFLEKKNLHSVVKDIKTALTIDLIGDRIGFRYSGELTGLKELEEIDIKLKDLFPKAKEEDFILGLKESNQAKEAGKYNLGFGIIYAQYNNSLTIIPILGKGKKDDPDGLYTRLEILKDSKDYRLAKPEGSTELIYLVNTLNRNNESKDEEFLWKTGMDFFQRASDFPLYFLGGYNYNLTKVSSRDLSERIYSFQTTARLRLFESEFFYELQLIYAFDGNEYIFQPGLSAPRFKAGFGFYDKKLLYFTDFRQAQGLEHLIHLLPYKFPKQQLNRVIEQVIQPLSAFLPFEDNQNVFSWVASDGVSQEELYIAELGGLVSFVPKVLYGDQLSINPLDPSMISDPVTGHFIERDSEGEQSFLNFVSELHPRFAKQLPKFLYTLTAVEFAEGLWFLDTFEKLKARGVKTFGLENIRIKRYSPFQAKVTTQFSSTVDWFGVHSEVSYVDEVIKLAKIRKAWENGEKFVQLGDGSLGKIPEEWMKKMVKLLRSGEVSGEEVRLSKVHFMLLEDWEESIEYAQIQKEVEEKKLKMSQFEGIREVAISQKVKAELRPYQKNGLHWLNFLRDFQWGGILADDMGLGKTLQMITLITQLEEQNPSIKVLIVAPTTLLFNWKKELEKFAPHLDFWIHHGERYETVEELTKHQLVLTSYGLVINDLEILKEIHWDLIVADESQAIKNTSSLRYKAMMRLKGKQRVALTGTPIENGIQELYAQMNFTNPGFFKTFNHFNGNFLTPIKKGDTDVVQSLKKQITPFVLRRTKKEVLTELPDKIEEFLYCEMGPVQRSIYEAKREEYRNFLLNKFDESGADQSKMFVLEGLTRLRQICDSPKLTEDTDLPSSSKIEMLKEHILEKTGNHKILVFSQFVKMLDLIREQLDQSSVTYSYLDGQTSLAERERQVQRFQVDESVRVFLISLKAGGTGLNLTAADYVYIVDPWWNPAVENQAIDRCYRMGQEKHVVAYRMICQNSIEEKIMELQSAKSQLAKDIIGDGEGILASLDREGMLELFS
jgi:superfamily II DNA or RNA helicase